MNSNAMKNIMTIKNIKFLKELKILLLNNVM